MDALKKTIEAQKKNGAYIIEKFLTPETARQLNNDVDAPLQQAEPRVRDADPAPQELHGKNTRRLSTLVAHSKTWREDIDDDDFHGLSQRPWEDCWQLRQLLAEHGIHDRHWARKLGAAAACRWRPPMMALWNMDSGGPDMMLNFLIATTDVAMENGATGIVRGATWSYKGEDAEWRMPFPSP